MEHNWFIRSFRLEPTLLVSTEPCGVHSSGSDSTREAKSSLLGLAYIPCNATRRAAMGYRVSLEAQGLGYI